MFEEAESPEMGWDALVEYSEGDTAIAKGIADKMVEKKRKAYEKPRSRIRRGRLREK